MKKQIPAAPTVSPMWGDADDLSARLRIGQIPDAPTVSPMWGDADGVL